MKIKADFMLPIMEAPYKDSPKAGEIIEVLVERTVVMLAWANGERFIGPYDNSVQFILEKYTGGVTVSSRISSAEYWRRPGEDEWKK